MIITINQRTPTVNNVYGYRGFRRFITRVGREIKEQIKEEVYEQIEAQRVELETLRDCELNVFIAVHEDWYCCDGRIKKKDLDNRAKFMIDTIFEQLEIDDSHIFKLAMIKKDDRKENFVMMIEKDDVNRD